MSYQESLDKATEADKVKSEFKDEKDEAAPPININLCRQWLESVNFPQDPEIWQRIKTMWIAFLSATSEAPDLVLAPNKKLVRGTEVTDDERFYDDREFRS